jgi:hypothetical protein
LTANTIGEERFSISYRATPWGTHSIAGVGAPPFALHDVELAVPQL